MDAPYTAPDGSLAALVDCDTFYASCEKVARPDLAGKPVVVLSNNDGCLVAMSREAKKLGLPMGEPALKVRHLLLKHNVAVFSSNYTLYGDMSRRVMQTIASVAPEMEIYSIDEAFVRMTGGLVPNAVEAATLIRQRVLRWVGLPVSIGIAPTKVLAKIATGVAKKYPACNGIFDLGRSRNIEMLLSSVPVGDIWGVGRRSALKLRANGILNALQLRDANPVFIRRLLTITGLNMQMELNGIPAIRDEIPVTHSTIISSRSLGRKISTLAPLEEAISFHAARAAEKLRQKRLLTRMVCARIQTAYYAEGEPRHDEMAMTTLASPTFDSAVIIGAALGALRRIFRPGFAYAKALVMLTDLSDPAKGQHDMLDLLDERKEKRESRKRLLDLVDTINRREGRGTIFFASQGLKNASWHMKREKLSRQWTTDVTQLLKVGGRPGEYHSAMQEPMRENLTINQHPDRAF